MVYGVLRLINFAHSEIFMIGTFATLQVMLLGITSPVGGLAWSVSCSCAMVAAGGRPAAPRSLWSAWRTGRCAKRRGPDWPR